LLLAPPGSQWLREAADNFWSRRIVRVLGPFGRARHGVRKFHRLLRVPQSSDAKYLTSEGLPVP